MANLFFKRGKRSSLNNAPLNDGTIYVTTDERAIYVDYLPEATQEVPNPSVQRIRLGDFREYADFSTIMNIPVAQLDTSALYYATAENILCKWTGDESAANSGWVQVNPQASLSTIVRKVWNTSTSITSGVRIDTQLRDANDRGPTGKVSYVAGNAGLGISASNNQITGEVIMTLTPERIVENATLSVRTNDDSGLIELVITNTKTGTGADGSTINTSTESVIPLSGQGILIGEDNGELTLTNTGGVNSISNAFDANGNFTTSVALTGSTRTSTALTPIIRYGNTAQDAVFANGTAVLSIYTKAEVDDKISNELRAANAMKFCGPVDQSNDLPTTNVHNGDTYKAAANGDYWLNSTQDEYLFTDCRVGDMFIATGNEGSDGVIPASDLNWTYIPSGNDDVQSFRFRYQASTQKIELVNSNDSVVSTITPGTDIVFSSSANNDVTISHATVTRTNSTGTDITQQSGIEDLEFNVITGITTSSTGHVTGVETTKITIADEFNKLSALNVTASIEQATGNAKIHLDVSDVKGYHAQSDVVLHSESLTFSTTNNVTNIEMQWGSF